MSRLALLQAIRPSDYRTASRDSQCWHIGMCLIKNTRSTKIRKSLQSGRAQIHGALCMYT
jgi:hypothetical protein